MGSLPKDTHQFAFAMFEAARIMPADRAEKLDQIKQLRSKVQLKNLRKRNHLELNFCANTMSLLIRDN
tara:strand:+ start:468 stop:671 length:204 start_codon:yes stop_codon:yes gene_type:complete